MAIRFDATGDRVERTSGLLNYNAAYTVMLWARPVGWTTGTWSNVISISTSSYNNCDGLATDDAFDEWMPFVAAGGAWDADQSSPVDAAVNTWVHLALVRESATVLKAYADGALIATVSHPTVAGRSSATALRLGDTPAADGLFDGCVAHVKAWSAALTIDEVQAERPYIAPVKAASLYAWWPTRAGDSERLLDYSGNGRHWTAVGTLTDEADPGIAWSPVAARRTLSPRVGSRQALCTN